MSWKSSLYKKENLKTEALLIHLSLQRKQLLRLPGSSFLCAFLYILGTFHFFFFLGFTLLNLYMKMPLHPREVYWYPDGVSSFSFLTIIVEKVRVCSWPDVKLVAFSLIHSHSGYSSAELEIGNFAHSSKWWQMRAADTPNPKHASLSKETSVCSRG